MRRVGTALDELLQPLSGERRLLSEWTEPILNLVVEFYGSGELDREAPRDRLILAVSEAVADCLNEFRELDAKLAPRTTGAEALRIVLSRIGSTRLPPTGQGGEVEMLGWLELPLDDARALVVTGVNEGIVPASQNGDLFLPDRLRTALRAGRQRPPLRTRSLCAGSVGGIADRAQTDRRSPHQRSRAAGPQPVAVCLRQRGTGPACQGILLARRPFAPAAVAALSARRSLGDRAARFHNPVRSAAR